MKPAMKTLQCHSDGSSATSGTFKPPVVFFVRPAGMMYLHDSLCSRSLLQVPPLNTIKILSTLASEKIQLLESGVTAPCLTVKPV